MCFIRIDLRWWVSVYLFTLTLWWLKLHTTLFSFSTCFFHSQPDGHTHMRCYSKHKSWIPSLINTLFISWSVWILPSVPPSPHWRMSLGLFADGRSSLPDRRALCRPLLGPAAAYGTAWPAPRRPGRLSEPWWWRMLWSEPPCGSGETLPTSRRHGGCWWG